MRRILSKICLFLGAGAMALAPGLSLSVQRKVLPDAADFFGYVYQLIARGFAAVSDDRLTVALLFAVCLWLLGRSLFHKPERTGVGEYLLSGFFAVMMLLCKAARTEDTVAVLWANAFQLCIALLYLVGMYLIGLCLLRELYRLTTREVRPLSLRAPSTFLRCFAVIALCWLPHIIIRYPGVLMWDSYMQIKQFMGEAARWANHPPFGTFLYGSVAALGEAVGNKNLIYFLFTLSQCACFIAVLAYTLTELRRLGAPEWVRLLALALYAFSPCYVGWATVIAKDTAFLIAALLLTISLYSFAVEPKGFAQSRKQLLLFGLSFLGLMLSRHNGLPMCAVVLVAMGIVLLVRKQGKALLRVLLTGGVCIVIALGAEAIVVSTLSIQSRFMPDVYSLPFQQTARVVKLHSEEIPQEEREAIDAVLPYDALAENYNDWYADSVKDTYRSAATAEDRAAYFRVWLAQLLRYPADYLDATLHMNGVLFDLADNRPMYICFSDMDIDTYVYPYSFNDMSMYEAEALRPLNAAQRALTEWYVDFDQLPLVGLFASMSFSVYLMLALLYLGWVSGKGRRLHLLLWLPALITFAACLFSPVVYLRYALPVVCALPVGLAAHCQQSCKKVTDVLQ